MSGFNPELFFGVLIGIVAYVLLYIGKGIQKLAIEGLKTDKTVKSKHSGVWIFGLVLTTLFLFVQWIPLSLLHTPMNLIAPLEGIGLVTLLIFSYFVLKEKITVQELIAIVLIIIGTILINVIAVTPEELQRTELSITALLVSFGTFLVIAIIGYLIVFRKSDTATGIIVGLAAGCFMAFQTLAKRITDIAELAITFTVVTIILAIATLGFTQLALAKTRANIVIPCFTSTSIVLTTLLGIIVIDEQIQVMQIIGITIIVLGIITMNAKKDLAKAKVKDEELKEEKKPVPSSQESLESRI